MRATGRLIAVVACASLAPPACRSGDASAPRSCEPTRVEVVEQGEHGTVTMTVSCVGAGEPLDARVRFGADALSAMTTQGQGARTSGERVAVVTALGGGAESAGTVTLAMDPATHAIDGVVRAKDARLSGAFTGNYRLVCRVPAAVLDVQANGVRKPSSDSLREDEALSTSFCRRFAPLR